MSDFLLNISVIYFYIAIISVIFKLYRETSHHLSSKAAIKNLELSYAIDTRKIDDKKYIQRQLLKYANNTTSDNMITESEILNYVKLLVYLKTLNIDVDIQSRRKGKNDSERLLNEFTSAYVGRKKIYDYHYNKKDIINIRSAFIKQDYINRYKNIKSNFGHADESFIRSNSSYLSDELKEELL